mgnify:CR=1 FL=1
MKKLFVRNLSFEAREEGLREILEKVSTAIKVSMPRDRVTGKARGFAFVEVENDDDASKIMKEASGAELGGRKIDITLQQENKNKVSRRDEDYNER